MNQSIPGAFDLANEHLHFNAQGKAETIAADRLWSLSPEEMNARFGHILVSSFAFDADWATWEMHPHGDELACLLEGRADLVLRNGSDAAAAESVVALQAGDSFLIPQGTWHTARTTSACRLMLVTYGKGTEVMPKEEMERD
jgi:mannose-6-phosphate isomerase-like protein (cupin superfamily)